MCARCRDDDIYEDTQLSAGSDMSECVAKKETGDCWDLATKDKEELTLHFSRGRGHFNP